MTMAYADERSVVALGPAPTRASLSVTAGLHSGVRLTLDRRDYRIGSALGADIVLRDAAVAADHAILRVSQSGIHLHAIGGEVGVGDVTVAQGRGCGLKLPARIEIGAARLLIDEPPRRERRRQWAVLAAAAVVLIAVMAFWGTAPQVGAAFGHAGPVTAIDADATSGARAAESAARPTRETTAQLEEAARRFGELLGTKGIRTVKVSPSGRNVSASGTIGKAESPAWTEAEQWFDQTYGGRIVLSANVTTGERAAPVLDVRAVWLGEYPYVIAADGVRHYQGAFLDNGWTIKDINRDRILLAKGGETFALVYQ